MCDFIDEFINNPVYTNGTADDFQLRVCRILENEMIRVEI
jgi:hypothetical protein